MGVDPGSRVTGYAFLHCRGQRSLGAGGWEVLEAGVLRVDPGLPYIQRLGLLHEAMFDLLERHQPDVCVIEKAFCGSNASSALKLGEMRGAYMAACARAAVPVAEITPAEVKKTTTGNGRAEKQHVALAVRTLLGFDRGHLPHDVTDALAISLSHAIVMNVSTCD